jgi:hypothetical protein
MMMHRIWIGMIDHYFFFVESMSHNQRLGVLESKLANLSFAHRSTLHQVIFHLAK